MEKVLYSALSALMFLTFLSGAMALEKRDLAFVGALGADYPFDSGQGQLSPVILGSYISYIGYDRYNEIVVTTTTVSNTFGFDNGVIHAGIKPLVAHSVEGAFRTFDKGYLYKKYDIAGHYVAPVVFFDYRFINQDNILLAAKFNYRPSYYFYTKTDDNTIDMPDNHWAHVPSLEIVFENISTPEDDPFRLMKHGVKLSMKYEYMHRVGYGTYKTDEWFFGDGLETDINQSHKFYMDAGVYYNIRNKLILLLDVKSAYHRDVDVNNAEKIGSYTAGHANIPGYYNTEFRHNHYVLGQVQMGIPVKFWGTHIQPGFNMLYMPEDNQVVGQTDYNKTIYRSVSLMTFTKLGGELPFFLNYAYGIDAERRSSLSKEPVSGCHEVIAFVVFGFGSTGKSGSK